MMSFTCPMSSRISRGWRPTVCGRMTVSSSGFSRAQRAAEVLLALLQALHLAAVGLHALAPAPATLFPFPLKEREKVSYTLAFGTF